MGAPSMGDTPNIAASAVVYLASCLGCSSPANPPAAGSGFSLIVSANMSGTPGPLAGVSVAIDQGDGSRFEGTTGVDGTVTFPDVDVANGPLSFTAACPGYVAITDLGITQTGTWTLTMSPVGNDPSYADVSGIVLGKKDVNDDLFLSTTVPSTTFFGIGPEYAIRVTPAEPFSVIAAEVANGPASSSPNELGMVFQQWAQFEAPAASGAVALDLTFPNSGQPLLPLTANGSLLVPTLMADAQAYLQVTTEASNETAFLGHSTSVVATAGGVLDYAAEYVVPVGQDVETLYWLTSNGAYSDVIQDGPPSGSSAPIEFLDPPSLPSPLPLYGSLPVTNVDPTLMVSVGIERDDESIVWRVFAAPSSVPMRLPKLPSAIDPRVILGTGRVSAVPEACSLGASQRCAKWALGIPADLESP